MPAPKGHPKWGGKKKGCKHVFLAGTVRERLAERGHDPVDALIDIAEDPASSPELKAHVEAKLMRFVYPELRSTEITGPAGGPVHVVNENSSALQSLENRLDGIAARIGTQSGTIET